MEGRHLRLEIPPPAILDQMTHRLLGAAGPQVIDNVQQAIGWGHVELMSPSAKALLRAV